MEIRNRKMELVVTIMLCLILLTGFISFFSDNMILGIVLLIGGGLGSYGCITNEEFIKQREIREAAQKAESIQCQKPILVSEIDGVKLYKRAEGCHDPHPVYFSVNGVQQSWTECIGRHCSKVTRNTPNTNRLNKTKPTGESSE